jgi:CheY-like chemotaxis protein
MTDDRVSILLVDDRPENLLALEAILEPLSQVLVRAGSGPEALRQVLATDFAVMLLDVQMPGMNGFEVAEIIKSRERSRTIPIIFLSAISKEDAYVFRVTRWVRRLLSHSTPTLRSSRCSSTCSSSSCFAGAGQLLRDSQSANKTEHRTSLLKPGTLHAKLSPG